MKQFLKRYWHDVPFLALALRAVWLASVVWGLGVFLYFFVVVVPIEVRHYQKEKARKALVSKTKIV